MKRLIIIGEGQTEQDYCKDVLETFFTTKNIHVQNTTIKKSKGGIQKWSIIKKQILNHLKSDTSDIITLLIGSIGGFLFLRFRIPGALIIGSILSVAIFNIFFDSALVLKESRPIAQVIAGAFIGAGISKTDLLHMKSIGKPAAVILSGLLILSIITGITMYLISPMDLTTSLMSAIPGGMSYMPLLSE